MKGGLPEAVRRPLVAAGATLVPALIALVEDALADDQTPIGRALLDAIDLLWCPRGCPGAPGLLRCLDLEDELDLRVEQAEKARPYGRSAPAPPSKTVSRRMLRRPGTPSAIHWPAS